MNWHSQQNDESERPFYPSLPHIPKVDQRWFTPAEMDQIIDISAGYPGRGILKGQYKLLFRLDAYSGLRSGEISGLHAEDINFARGFIHVQRSVFDGVEVPTKGKRNRNVYLDSTTLHMLKQYLGVRTTRRLFQGNNGKPIRNQQLNTVLTWATEQLSIARGTMHAFRHGRNSHMRQNGVPGNIILEQVGHLNEQTNLIYTHNEEAFIREVVEKLAGSCIQTPVLYPN
jgi:integrase